MLPYFRYIKLNETAFIYQGWVISVILRTTPNSPLVHINCKKYMVPEDWGQSITLQPVTVPWITSLFKSLEVRQSNSFFTRPGQKSLFRGWEPWWYGFNLPGCTCYPSLRYCYYPGHWQTCPLLSLAESLLCLAAPACHSRRHWPLHSQSTLLILMEHGNTRGLTTFWNKWEKKNIIKTKYY